MTSIERNEEIFIESLKEISEANLNIIAKAVLMLNSDSNLLHFLEDSARSLRLEDLNLDLLEASLAFGITDPIGQLARWIYDRLKELSSWFAATVQAMIYPIKHSIDSIISYIVTIPERVGSIISSAISGLVSIAERTWSFLTIISDRIVSGFSALSSIVSQALSQVMSGIAKLGESLAAFAEHVKHLGAQVMGGIANIQNFIVGFIEWIKNLPQALYEIFKPAIDFLVSLGEAIKAFFSNPIDVISRYILVPLWEGFKFIGERIWDGLAWTGSQIISNLSALSQMISSFLNALWSGLSQAFVSFTDFVFSSLRALGEGLKDIFSRIMVFFISAITDISAQIHSALLILIQPVIETLYASMGISTVPYLTVTNFLSAMSISSALTIPFLVYPLLISVPIRALSFGIRGLAMGLKNLTLEKTISLKPLGIGVDLKLDFVKAIGATIYTFGEELGKYVDRFYEPVWFGLGFWFTRYMTSIITYFIRNYIPIEFPTVKEVEEAWLKSRVADTIPQELGRSYKDIQDGFIYYLKLKGYSDFLIDYQFADPLRLHTTVIDRFGITRIVPLGGVWKLPSISDIARMWVRDVLRPPQIDVETMIRNLTKIYEATGLYRDIGLLYTLLAFKYPPPEKLAAFYWRGIAGVLWLESTLEEPEWKQLFNITWKATPPFALNFIENRAKILNDMISTYMRWHDLFPAPWAPGFPTDKSIVVELMADLPTRIDLRWLTRWGIFQHLSDARIDVMADLKTIYSSFSHLTGEEVRSLKTTPEIKLDVRMLSRFLIATGLNPLLAPLVSVSHATAALSSELTLLRTGFIEALRRGFITLDTSEILMSGLIKINFLTGFIDPSTGSFNEITYPKPVFWLPAERRLLQLRAVLDRYNILLRLLLDRINRGIIYLAIFPEEGAEILALFHRYLSEHIGKLAKSITGVDWTPALDSEYMSIWIAYGSLLVPIGARTWIRRYISRYLGWIFYRVLYGWISFEDFSRIIDAIASIKVNEKEIKILTDIEVAFFKSLSNTLVDIIKKENIPSPSTLSTLAEYMVIDESLILDSLEKHKVPAEYWNLWKTYITVKPVKADYKSLIRTASRAYRHEAISEDELLRILQEALSYGFTQREIDILMRIIDLELKIERSKEWSPTLLTIITISELVPEALNLLELYPIKKEFREVIQKYAERKPLADEIRSLVSTYYRALRYAAFYGQTIPEELERKISIYMKKHGVTEEEKEIRSLTTQIEVLIDTWIRGEVLPSLSALVSMSEYIEISIDYIISILQRRRVEKTYAEYWLRYIYSKSLEREVNRVVSAFQSLYVRFTVPEELIITIKDLMSIGGWTPRELEIFDLELYLRKQYRVLTVLIPTLRQFLSDGAYLPRYEALLEDLFKVYGISIREYSKQLEYYKKLLKNRRLWRHFSFYRAQLTYAYQYGAITLDAAKEKLKKFLEIGLIDEDELNMILEAMELRRVGYISYRARRTSI